MTTYNHTQIATGAAANAAVVNSPLGQIDAALGQLTTLTTTANSSAVVAINEVRAQAITGGANVTDAQLRAWTEAGAYEMTSITYSSNYTGVVSTATVKWPDASAGTFTATTINATFEAIDAYTITHTASSKTVTQTAVTRNSEGAVTTKPALTVA